MSKQITILRKAGKLEEAYNLAQSLIRESDPSHSSFVWIQRAFSWVLYDQLKAIDYIERNSDWFQKITEIINTEIDSSEEMFWNAISSCIYKNLKHIPVDNHSLIIEFFNKIPIAKLIESNSTQYLNYFFHKHLKEHNQYGSVIENLGFDNFIEEDYQHYKMDNGKSIMSHVEQVICAYSKWLLKGSFNPMDPYSPMYDAEKITSWIATIDTLSEGRNMKFPEYCKTKLLIAIGENKIAKETMLPFVKRNSSQFWVWSLLAELEENQEIKANLIAKALSCNAKDEFLINVRKDLAEYFITQSCWGMAKYQLQKISKVASQKGYSMSNRVISLLNDNRVIQTSLSIDIEVQLVKMADKAINVLHADLPSRQIIITYINNKKGLASFYESKSENGFFPLSILNFEPQIGDTLEVKVKEKAENGYTKFYSCSKLQTLHNDIKMISATVETTNDRSFSILENCYFHHSLLHGQSGNYHVQFIAIPSFDKHKNKWSYKAIKLVKSRKIIILDAA